MEYFVDFLIKNQEKLGQWSIFDAVNCYLAGASRRYTAGQIAEMLRQAEKAMKMESDLSAV